MTQPDIPEPGASRFTIPLWAWAAAAAVILFLAVTLWQARQWQQQLAATREEFRRAQAERARLEAQRREMEEIFAIVAAPATRQVILSGGAGAPAVKTYWNEERGVVLSAQNMPVLAAGRTFQLWVVPKKGNPVSAGIFRPDAAGNLLQFMRAERRIGVKDVAALTISEEPAGGNTQPTTKPGWVGPIRLKSHGKVVIPSRPARDDEECFY